MSSSFKKLNGNTALSHATTPPSETEDVSENVDSVFEKKCRLINRQLDAFGMGKYQWFIWVLCGFGYLIDLLWAQAFGLVLSPIQQELGFPGTVFLSEILQTHLLINAANQSGNISVAFSSGLTAGAFIWGVLVDVIGWPGLP
jgi:hypothetical protein